MHQTSDNMYIPISYGSLRVTPIASGVEAPKRHGKNTAVLSSCIILILPSVIMNNKDLLNTRLIFNFYVQISCKNDWNNVFLLNTNASLKTHVDTVQLDIWIFMWLDYYLDFYEKTTHMRPEPVTMRVMALQGNRST